MRSFLGGLLMLAVTVPAAAQTPVGVVTGVVRDSAGQVIAGVAVAVVNSVITTLVTNDSGAFRLDNAPVGPLRIFARRLRFSPETVSVVVAAGAEARADFRLVATATVLEGSVIEADPLRGKMGPFNRRRARGVGAFITRADIEKRQASSLSELLRYLPGVRVQQRMAGEPQPIGMQRSMTSTMQNCAVLIYVDGHPYPNGNLDDFAPNAIEGVEVYRSASEIPADFRTRDATCGIVAIWTRDPAAARRKP